MSKSLFDDSIKLLHITGISYCGSTVFGGLLGSNDNVLAVGELERFTRFGPLHSRLCSCGETGDVCSFWSKVIQVWSQSIQDFDIDQYRALQLRFERLRALPRLFMESQTASSEFKSYSLYTWNLVDALSEIKDSPVIVDTSKNPARALALSLVPGLDVRIIHLIRDGRGFLWSRMRPFYKKGDPDPQSVQLMKSAALNSMEWILINLVTEIVVKMAKVPSVRIYYENFTSTPSSLLEAMRSVVADWTTDGFTDKKPGEEVMFGHMIGGNRVRMQQAVKLSYDDEWKKRLSIREQRIFWLFGGLLARRYGYTFS